MTKQRQSTELPESELPVITINYDGFTEIFATTKTVHYQINKAVITNSPIHDFAHGVS